MQIIAQHGDIFIILACLFGFFLSWLITLPAGAGLAIVFFFMFKGMFG